MEKRDKKNDDNDNREKEDSITINDKDNDNGNILMRTKIVTIVSKLKIIMKIYTTNVFGIIC